MPPRPHRVSCELALPLAFNIILQVRTFRLRHSLMRMTVCFLLRRMRYVSSICRVLPPFLMPRYSVRLSRVSHRLSHLVRSSFFPSASFSSLLWTAVVARQEIVSPLRINSPAAPARGGPPRAERVLEHSPQVVDRRMRVPWTDAETTALIRGYKFYASSADKKRRNNIWTSILNDSRFKPVFHPKRTNLDLSNRFRNLTKQFPTLIQRR